MEKLLNWNNPDKIKELIIRLVNNPSISGTAGEVMMSGHIREIIEEIPYFQANRELVMDCPVKNDPLTRSSVVALFRGPVPSKKTVILLSHFDVVGVDDFGNLSDYAFQPEEYTEKLRTEVYDSLDKEAKLDLDSGEWLFGRGVMDMKAGLAVQLAVLSELSQDPDFSGNIVLVSTPDEEINSDGMFAAVPLLNKLKKQYELEYELCICSEPSFASYPTDMGKHIYTGAVGKLLPLIFCVGKETHVGEVLEGVNAGWMASEIVNKIELSEDFVDHVGDEKNPPPTCLKITDLKDQYNVQTPNAAYVLYNILTLSKSPKEVLETLRGYAEKAAQAIFNRIEHKYVSYQIQLDNWQQFYPQVYTYEELYTRGKELYGEDFELDMQAVLEDAHYSKLDSREVSVLLATKLTSYFRHETYYLLMFAPPFYPHVYLDSGVSRDRRIYEIVEKVVEYAGDRFGEKIEMKQYFTGLSDVSYCRFMEPESVAAIRENMPVLGSHYQIPIDDIMELNVPTVNIGPFGKDAHKWTERLHVDFSVRVTPELVKEGVLQALGVGRLKLD